MIIQRSLQTTIAEYILPTKMKLLLIDIFMIHLLFIFVIFNELFSNNSTNNKRQFYLTENEKQ